MIYIRSVASAVCVSGQLGPTLQEHVTGRNGDEEHTAAITMHKVRLLRKASPAYVEVKP